MILTKPNQPIAFSIVIPAYNEGDNLAIVLEEIMTTLNRFAIAQPYELLVIDDGSRDHTGQVADDYARRFACVRAFHHPTNSGMGSALRTGFENSRGEFVTFLPADGEVTGDQAVKLLQLAGDADYVGSSRLGYANEGIYQRRALHREFLTWGMRVLSRMILGFNPSRNSGIYLVRGPLLRSLPLNSRTGLIGLEILLHIRQRKAKVAHGEIEICPRLSGKSKIATISGFVKVLIEMFKIRRYVRRCATAATAVHSRAA
jgi:glycosyltransferase involved in cell wall biosynthesis